MSGWARRVHRGASTLSSVVTSCGYNAPYMIRMEKVKFGCALEDTCRAHGDIPGPLLVLVLCINKLGPHKRDVFRAPGHQGNVKKLTEFLEQGRLVNLDKFSVHTLASVLKKFLRKIPGGIFGAEVETSLLEAIQDETLPLDEKRDQIARIIGSLPLLTQRLLVLICGTLRTIAGGSETNRMSAEALGVSVAPSFFRSCDGINKTARMEDIVKFKSATRAMRFLIEQFGSSNVYGRENYEYYARMTGRALRVDDGWIFADRYPFSVHADAAAMLLGRAPPSLEISEVGADGSGALCDEDQVVPPWLLPTCGGVGAGAGAGLSSCASTPILNLSGVSQCEGGEVACCGRLSISLEDNTLLPHSLASMTTAAGAAAAAVAAASAAHRPTNVTSLSTSAATSALSSSNGISSTSHGDGRRGKMASHAATSAIVPTNRNSGNGSNNNDDDAQARARATREQLWHGITTATAPGAQRRASTATGVSPDSRLDYSSSPGSVYFASAGTGVAGAATEVSTGGNPTTTDHPAAPEQGQPPSAGLLLLSPTSMSTSSQQAGSELRRHRGEHTQQQDPSMHRRHSHHEPHQRQQQQQQLNSLEHRFLHHHHHNHQQYSHHQQQHHTHCYNSHHYPPLQQQQQQHHHHHHVCMSNVPAAPSSGGRHSVIGCEQANRGVVDGHHNHHDHDDGHDNHDEDNGDNKDAHCSGGHDHGRENTDVGRHNHQHRFHYDDDYDYEPELESGIQDDDEKFEVEEDGFIRSHDQLLVAAARESSAADSAAGSDPVDVVAAAADAHSRLGRMQIPIIIKGSPAKKPNLMTYSHTITDGLGFGAELRLRRENSRRECKECRDNGLETSSLMNNFTDDSWLPLENLQRETDGELPTQAKDSPATHKSMSFLPLVHERQTERMRTRSEWFLNAGPSKSSGCGGVAGTESVSASDLLSVSTSSSATNTASGASPTLAVAAPPTTTRASNCFLSPPAGMPNCCRVALSHTAAAAASTSSSLTTSLRSRGDDPASTPIVTGSPSSSNVLLTAPLTATRTPLAPLETSAVLGGSNSASPNSKSGRGNSTTVGGGAPGGGVSNGNGTSSNNNNNANNISSGATPTSMTGTNALSASALSVALSGSLLTVDRSSSTNSSSSNSSAPGVQRKASLKRSNSRKNKENSAHGAAKRTSSGSTISAAVETNGTSDGVSSAAASTVADNVTNIPATTAAHTQYKSRR